MPHVTLHTPRHERLSAGLVAFEVSGMASDEMVQRLLQKRVIASASPYKRSFARLAGSLLNTPEEVEAALAAVRRLG